MKSALKLLVFFGIGCLIGIVLVCAGIVSFTDMTWNINSRHPLFRFVGIQYAASIPNGELFRTDLSWIKNADEWEAEQTNACLL